MTGEVEVYSEPAGSEIEQWARDLGQAYQMATRLVTTSFVPATYNGKPEEAAAAIITGAELGMSPLAALRSIDIIHGVPGMRAIALRALVQSKGHEIWVEESTQTRAVVKGRRKGVDRVETSVWDLDRAGKLQLLGKDNWKKQPINMLLARATSEVARLIAADVLLGIPYSIEELEDQGDAQVAEQPAARRSSTRAQRKPLEQAPAAEPEIPQAEIEPPAAREPEPERSLEEEAAAADALEAERYAAERSLEEPSVDWDPPEVRG